MAQEQRVFGTPLDQATTEFAKRNPLLAAFVPDRWENAVDKLLPDSFEARMESKAQAAARRYSKMRTEFALGAGEVAAALWRICKYAAKRFGISDLVFGIYHLAQHHESTQAEDAIEGTVVTSPIMLQWLMYCCNVAMAAYCPTAKEFAQAAGCKVEQVVEIQPTTSHTRPAYVLGVDPSTKKVVLAFRGTTDLNDMLTDACAHCEPYCGGYVHWGMIKAARWFVKHKLHTLRELCDANPGFGLLLVGHSLGAGVATLLAHLIRQGDPEAGKVMQGIKLHAVGIATPAVLTAELAEGCCSYVSSVVLQHDLVPRFSIYNCFAMKEEMDATNWQQRVKATAADWAVPDVIERSQTYRKLARQSSVGAQSLARALAGFWMAVVTWFATLLHYLGLLGKSSDGAAAAPSSGAPNGSPEGQAGLKEVAASTAAAAGLVLHHPGLAPQTLAAIEQAVAEAASGDVHAVVAPGRLFFLKRTDPPKEEAEALRKAAAERKAAKAARRKAQKRRKAAAAARQLAEESSIEGVGEEEEEADVSDDEAEEPWPGSTYQLIKGKSSQRFKRIVLQDSCLVDHMVSAYVAAVQKLLAAHGTVCFSAAALAEASREQAEQAS